MKHDKGDLICTDSLIRAKSLAPREQVIRHLGVICLTFTFPRIFLPSIDGGHVAAFCKMGFCPSLSCSHLVMDHACGIRSPSMRIQMSQQVTAVSAGSRRSSNLGPTYRGARESHRVNVANRWRRAGARESMVLGHIRVLGAFFKHR